MGGLVQILTDFMGMEGSELFDIVHYYHYPVGLVWDQDRYSDGHPLESDLLTGPAQQAGLGY